MSYSKMNQYLESRDPRRKRDNQGNFIDSLEKKLFLFPSSLKFVQEILPLKLMCQRHILIESFCLTMSCSFQILLNGLSVFIIESCVNVIQVVAVEVNVQVATQL
jgi:hypothetical protein